MLKNLKLIIQIPCLNEEKTLGRTIKDIKTETPKLLELVDEIETLIIDDGSTDHTIQKAQEHNINHIIKLPENKGLAAAFQTGIDASLKLGADIILNTDADNQYSAESIYDVIKPIVEGKADIVVGARDIKGHEEFSFLKKKLQILGSTIVSKAAKTKIEDTTSGFRAYSCKAAVELLIHNPYTYTLESLISLSNNGNRLTIVDVPIKVNPKTRDSRLFKSIPSYVMRSAKVILKSAVLYSPIRFFGTIACLLMLMSFVSILPWLTDFVSTSDTSGNLQSIILAAAFFIASVQFFGLAVMANLVRINRQTSERALYAIRRVELESGIKPEYII